MKQHIKAKKKSHTHGNLSLLILKHAKLFYK